MILAVCSDNGYIQMLQQFQVDLWKVSKIVLLTSYDTTIPMRCLTYAIIKWPTVFRALGISPSRTRGIAGVYTKGMTPLESSLQIANSSTVPSAGMVVEVSTAQKTPTRQVAQPSTHSPNAPLASIDCTGPAPSVSEAKQMQPVCAATDRRSLEKGGQPEAMQRRDATLNPEETQQLNRVETHYSKPQDEQHPNSDGKQQSNPVTQIRKIVFSTAADQPDQSTSDLRGDPDDELI
jgi:hypothetical protein